MANIDRVLVVGLGSIGLRHIRIVREILPNSTIKILRHAVNNYCPPEANGIFMKLSDAIDYGPQIVVVANPSSKHLDIASTFAQIGSHLLVEKPLTDSFESSRQLVNICRQCNVTLMTGYNLRFLESLRIFRQAIDQEIVGKPLAIRAESGSYLPDWRPGFDYRKSVSAQHSLGGGVLLELSHEIDYLRWIFGDVISVWAQLGQKSSLEIDVEDSAIMNLEFFRPDNKEKINAAVNLDFYRHDPVRLCTVICEGGTLKWNALDGTVEKFCQGSTSWEAIFHGPLGLEMSYFAEWRNFLEAIDGVSPLFVTGEDGLAALEIIEAVRLSSSSRTVVSIADRQSLGVHK